MMIDGRRVCLFGGMVSTGGREQDGYFPYAGAMRHAEETILITDAGTTLCVRQFEGHTLSTRLT